MCTARLARCSRAEAEASTRSTDRGSVAAFMTVHGWLRWFGSLAFALVACGPSAGPGPGAPHATVRGVRVETSDPPVGARLVGPIEGSDGPDCAVFDSRGTEDGALADLQKAAARLGVDFVKVTAVTKPFSDHICVHKRYRIQGIGYALATPRPAPAPTAPAPPVAPAATAPIPTAPPPEATCTPTCSTGYVCRAGTCEPECEPACGPTQYCRFDRVCAPLPTRPAAPPVGPAPPSTP
jgi:hypothetical protein